MLGHGYMLRRTRRYGREAVEDFVICSGSAVRVPEASPGTGRPHQTRANEGRKVNITKYEIGNFIGLYGVGVARRTCILPQCEGP